MPAILEDSKEQRGRSRTLLRGWQILGVLAVLLVMLLVQTKWHHFVYIMSCEVNDVEQQVVNLTHFPLDYEGDPASLPVSIRYESVTLKLPDGADRLPAKESNMPSFAYEYSDGLVQGMFAHEIPLGTTGPGDTLTFDEGGYQRGFAMFNRWDMRFSFLMSQSELEQHVANQMEMLFAWPGCDELILFDLDEAKGWVYFNDDRAKIVEAFSKDETRFLSLFLKGDRFESRPLVEQIVRSIRFSDDE